MSKKKLYSFLTLISGNVGLVVALVLFLISDTSFRPWTNYISDLGSGPIGATIALGIMEALIAIFVSLLMILISKEIEKQFLRYMILCFALLAQTSLLVIGIFPFNPSMPISYEIHKIIAIIYFAFSAITDFFLAAHEFNTDKLSSITILLAGIFSLIFTIGFILQEYGSIPRNMIVYLSEWVYFIFAMSWLSLKILPRKKI